jgi:hypothetical protein
MVTPDQQVHATSRVAGTEPGKGLSPPPSKTQFKLHFVTSLFWYFYITSNFSCGYCRLVFVPYRISRKLSTSNWKHSTRKPCSLRVITEIILTFYAHFKGNYYVPTFNNPIVATISKVRGRTQNLSNTSTSMQNICWKTSKYSAVYRFHLTTAISKIKKIPFTIQSRD